MVFLVVMYIVPNPYSGLKVGLALLWGRGGGTTIKTPSGTVVNINSFQIHIVCCYFVSFIVRSLRAVPGVVRPWGL